MKEWIVLIVSAALLTGCTEQQQKAVMGTLIGTTVGALSSSKNSKRNALIGGALGLFGGAMVGKQQQSVERPIIYQREGLAEENARLRNEVNQYRLEKENQRLRLENERLRRLDSKGRVSRGACNRGIF